MQTSSTHEFLDRECGGGILEPAHDPSRFSPVFILATARSYSSVVVTMIGQHPELAGLPELKLFTYPAVGGLETSLPRYWIERGLVHRSPGLLRALAEFEFGGQTPAALAAAREWLQKRRHWTGAGVCDVLMERLRPRVAAEKSPESVASDESLERMADAYPRARYIHLTRHPITTMRSMLEHLARTAPEKARNEEPTGLIGAWYETNRRILRFAADLPDDRYLRVRAEDVLHDSTPHLRRIAGWLGIRTDDIALETMKHPESSVFANPWPLDRSAPGGNDPGFLRDPIPHRVEIPRHLEPPKGWAADASVWEMVVALANRLGYFGERDVSQRIESRDGNRVAKSC